MSIADLFPSIRENREKLIASPLDGSYQPKTMRGVEIPKPGWESPTRDPNRGGLSCAAGDSEVLKIQMKSTQ
jgi:hypothetical protein